MDYHKRPEWSYSQMKLILDSGIDYAVASKRGLLLEPESPAIDLGQLTHMLILGGEDNFAVSEFEDFRTKAAREWRDEQKSQGKWIITKQQFAAVDKMVKHIENHPHSSKYLIGENIKHEVELYAKTEEGVSLRGKADAILYKDGKPSIITDIKTTAQFDKFFKSASWKHYDLQAATYTLISGVEMVNYYFCVVETIEPYRVQFMHASLEFLESGERKLRKCIDQIVEFGDKEPNFMIEDVAELGDYSL